MRTRAYTTLIVATLTPWIACQSASENEARTGSAPASRAQDESHLALGARLYGQHCATCHGDRGAGDGPASPFLFPEARDFTQGRFRLVRTDNGVPTREDLVGTLRRGMPGSAMPSWQWMGATELDAVASYVEHLTVRGLAQDLALEGRSDEQALAEARSRFTPGAALPEAVVRDTDDARTGRALYDRHCASCHAPDGSGNTEPKFDEDGTLNWPRDLTAGFLKGESSARAIGWRVQAGLPGTPMPATNLEQGDLDALVGYVKSLVPPEAETARVHRRDKVVAARLDALPSSPDDPVWERTAEIEVVLAPLDAARTGGGVTSAHLAAVHDGEAVAVRLRWPDPSANLRVYSDLAGPDGCALLFTTDENPRFFGMGAPAHRSSIWHWKALRAEETAGAVDLLDPPHALTQTFRGDVRTDVPIYQPTLSVPDVSETVESLHGGGVGALARKGSGDGAEPARATPSWNNGEWSVVFTRSCEPEGSRSDGTALLPGTVLNVSVAIWNGSAGDRGARKSISIWQELELAP